MRSISDWRSFFMVAAIAAGGAFGGIVWWESRSAREPSAVYAQQAANSDVARLNLSAVAGADQLSGAFREVARALKPSVVSIHAIVEAKARPQVRRGRGGLPPEFEEFFGRQFPGFNFEFPEAPEEQAQPGRPQRAGQGSGVIVSRDGHILTNNHVVQNADKLEVVLSDDRKFEAKVIGTDPKVDIAVLKIDANGLTPALIGDSSMMQVGDWVIAIGSPFGLTQTVTSGIVSATHREEFGITQYDDFIQTDAAINPGNSGGPLLNLRGEVIGINTAIASPSGGFNGVGFAIPSNTADSVMKSILKYGKVTRGFVGISLGELTDEIAKAIDIPAGSQGAYVGGVGRDGPADKGGVKAGDVITSVNGEKVKTAAQLKRIVASLPVDKPAAFEVLRDGKTVKLSVVIEEQTDEKLKQLAGMEVVTELGIEVEAVTSDKAQELGLSKKDGGVVVTSIEQSSPLKNYVRVGEVIVRIGNNIIANAEDFANAVGSAGKQFMMVVVNGRQIRQQLVTLP
jgi:serine protease Do